MKNFPLCRTPQTDLSKGGRAQGSGFRAVSVEFGVSGLGSKVRALIFILNRKSNSGWGVRYLQGNGRGGWGAMIL